MEKLAQSRNQTPSLSTWQHHEDHVAALYRRLGFTVTQNVSVDGKQIDLICENWIAGIGHTRLCIDCKHTRLDENKSVSKDDVDMFIFEFRNRAESNAWTAGIMVSNRPFSQYAKAAAAKHPHIHLKTIDELHEEILHIRPYLHDSIRRYEEESGRFFDFVPPYGIESQTPQPSSNNPLLLEAIVKNWLEADSVQQLCLFGDFGTGKTTFLEFLHYRFAKKYLQDASVRIPLMIPLRKYYEASDNEEIIAQFFSQECGINVQYSLFQEFLLKGRLLLLLDGFDEMGAKSDPTIRKANYLKLAPLIEGKAKILISCRPAYFLSLNETHSVFSFVNEQVGFAPPLKQGPVSEQLFRRVQDSDLTAIFSKTKTALSGTLYAHINLFDKKQIRAYLKKHDQDIKVASEGELDSKKLFIRLREIYDLEDLATRPILLKLIVSTLPLFRRSPSGGYEIKMAQSIQKVPDITPSVLYAVYTEKELEREYMKGKIRWLIDRQSKVRVIAAIAFEMFRQDVVGLDRATVSRVVQQSFPGSETDQAYYLTDIRTCSFLNRDVQDSVRFTHKSFMEYYAAVHMRMIMSNAQTAQDLLSMKPFSDEVAFFLGDGIAAGPNPDEMGNLLGELYTRLSSVPSPSVTCIQNLLNILNYTRKPPLRLNKANVDWLVYRKLYLREQSAEELLIGALRTIKLQVGKWSIARSEIRRWDADGTQIKELLGNIVDFRALRFWNTRIERCEIVKSTVHIETWRDSIIRNGTFRDTTIINSGKLGSNWLPERGTFENCVLVGLDLGSASPHNLQFKNCSLVMCRCDHIIKELAVQGCRGVLIMKGSAGFERLGTHLAFCGLETVKMMRKKSTVGAVSWPELLISCFEPDVEKLPRGASEIRTRLRQIDIALQLTGRLNEVAIVSGSDFANNEECRIIKCDWQTVTLFNLNTKQKFDEMLRKIFIENDAKGRVYIKIR